MVCCIGYLSLSCHPPVHLHPSTYTCPLQTASNPQPTPTHPPPFAREDQASVPSPGHSKSTCPTLSPLSLLPLPPWTTVCTQEALCSYMRESSCPLIVTSPNNNVSEVLYASGATVCFQANLLTSWVMRQMLSNRPPGPLHPIPQPLGRACLVPTVPQVPYTRCLNPTLDHHAPTSLHPKLNPRPNKQCASKHKHSARLSLYALLV